MGIRANVMALTVLSLVGCSDRVTEPADLPSVERSASGIAPAGLTGSGVPMVVSDIQVVDLGTLPGGSGSSARDINDAGEIVGWSGTSSGETHAFVLTPGGMTDLGTFPGGDLSQAFGINDLGQVVGHARNESGVFHAFFWDTGPIQDLGAFPPEDHLGSESHAYDINDDGLVAGSVDLAGVVWDLDGTPNFPPFPPNVRVTDPGPFKPAVSFAVNDAGQVAGTLLSDAQGFRWQAGVLEPLAVLGALDDDAFGIDGTGRVVGRGLLAPPEIPPLRYHAVLWPDPGTVIDLGALGDGDSQARDLNEDGLVVGSSETDEGTTVAIIWTAEVGMQSLGTLGGDNSAAYAVNASGQIVGESQTATGETHAALWTVAFAVVVPIDIKPGSDSNPVDPHSSGLIPVALLGTEYFDVGDVDPATLAFGPDGAGIVHGSPHPEDVNGDGRLDLVLHFPTEDTGIVCGDTEATLRGSTVDTQAFQGTQAIRTVGCDG